MRTKSVILTSIYLIKAALRKYEKDIGTKARSEAENGEKSNEIIPYWEDFRYTSRPTYQDEQEGEIEQKQDLSNENNDDVDNTSEETKDKNLGIVGEWTTVEPVREESLSTVATSSPIVFTKANKKRSFIEYSNLDSRVLMPQSLNNENNVKYIHSNLNNSNLDEYIDGINAKKSPSYNTLSNVITENDTKSLFRTRKSSKRSAFIDPNQNKTS